MTTSLSKLLFQSIERNSYFKFLGKKIDNSWHWSNKKKLYDSVVNSRYTLKRYNIKKGDRVIYKGDNSLEWLSWNLAVNSIGAIWVPLSNNQNLNNYKYIINDCKPKLLITDDQYLKVDTPIIQNGITKLKKYEEIDFVYNEISTLIYTSGLYSKPKGVMLSNNNIISSLKTFHNLFGNIGPITSLNILPWTNVHSLTYELYYNLLYDNKIALCSNKDKFLDECKEINPDIIYVTPSILEMIKNKLELLNKPVVRFVVSMLFYILSTIYGKLC